MKHTTLTDELHEKASLFAAGALTKSEESEYLRHLEDEGCDTCRNEADKLKSVMSFFAFSVPEQAPSPDIRKRLLEQARATAPPRNEAVAPQRRWLQWVTTLAAVAATASLVFVMNANQELRQLNNEMMDRIAQLQTQVGQQTLMLATLSSPRVRVVNLAGQGTTPGANARIFWDQSQKRWLFYVSDLPQVASNLSYQLWFVPTAGNPVSATVFNTDANGSATLEIALPDGLTELKAAAVTTEPAGGLPQPSGAFALLGTL